MSAPILVTRPKLPPLADLIPMLEEIWESLTLTNSGPFHQRLEARLRDYLELENGTLVTNGMIALEQVIDAAGLSGEIVTTPYWFVATTHASRRAQLRPVFVDVRPEDLNIDPARIERRSRRRRAPASPPIATAVPARPRRSRRSPTATASRSSTTPPTSLASATEARASPAHRDYATVSLHATKVFNTFEGGLIVTPASADRTAIERRRNFGIIDEVTPRPRNQRQDERVPRRGRPPPARPF